MMREAAVGTTSMLACLFFTTNFTVTFNPFQSLVALATSSPTFLGDWVEGREGGRGREREREREREGVRKGVSGTSH